MIERNEFLAAITAAKVALHQATQALYDFDSQIENNVFKSLNEAEGALTHRFELIADDACGSYRYGSNAYAQEFIVDGERYEARIEFDYNRHDKRWYYIDETRYSYKKL